MALDLLKALGNDTTWKPRAVAIFVIVGSKKLCYRTKFCYFTLWNCNVKRSCTFSKFCYHKWWHRHSHLTSSRIHHAIITGCKKL